MSWLSRLFTPALDRVKRDALKEIDRTIEMLESGGMVIVSVDFLRNTLSKLMAGAKLGSPLGGLIVDIALAQVDWIGLRQKASPQVVIELQRLRKQIEGARL